MHSNLLLIEERIKAAIQAGESNFREFKTAWHGAEGAKSPRSAQAIRKDIGEALVAFANADGGMLLLGVEDDGKVTGVPHSPSDIESFVDAPVTHVHPDTRLPSPQVGKQTIMGKTVLYFGVDKSTKLVHLTNEGRCLQRKDRDSVPVPTEQIRFERQEQISREYDRVYVDGADLSALDLDVVKRAGETIAPGFSPEKLLQLLDLADFDGMTVRLRRAALLLFARDVVRWHPRCEVRVVRIAGHELKTGKAYNVKSDETVRGSVFLIMSKAWDNLRPHLVQTVFGSEGLFEERIMYPEDACREALTNAIAHRDYSIEGRSIEVLIFDDRIEVRSPGGLLSNVSIDALKTLKGVHQSRNAKLTRVLRELGYVREMGEGIRRMYQLMKANDLVDPELATDFEGFNVVLKNRSVFSQEAQRWIDGFEKFNLSREEKKLVLLGHNGALFSPQNIIDSLGIVDIDYYRVLLEGVQLKGLLVSKRQQVPPNRAANRRSGGGKRGVARFSMRVPQECELYLSELIRALQELGPRSRVTKTQLRTLSESLGSESPYRTRSFPLNRTLAALGFINQDGIPTARLLAIWDSSKAIHQAQKKVPSDLLKPGGAFSKLPPNKLTVSSIRSRTIADTPETTAQITTRTIFVGNLPSEFEFDDLKEVLSRFGHVEKLHVPIDVFTGRLRGFAFVDYGSSSEAQEALFGLRGILFKGRKLRSDVARPRDTAREVISMKRG